MTKVEAALFPINKLYYEMIIYFKQKLNRRDW